MKVEKGVSWHSGPIGTALHFCWQQWEETTNYKRRTSGDLGDLPPPQGGQRGGESRRLGALFTVQQEGVIQKVKIVFWDRGDQTANISRAVQLFFPGLRDTSNGRGVAGRRG